MRFVWLAVLVFAFLFGVLYVERLATKPVYTVGSLLTPDATSLVALINSAGTLTADYYDTFESPRGTPYQVPAGKLLYIGALLGTPDVSGSAPIHIRVGYADDAVQNSVTPPTNAVFVHDASFDQPLTMPNPRSVWIPIPAGKYPFIQMAPKGSTQATGIVP